MGMHVYSLALKAIFTLVGKTVVNRSLLKRVLEASANCSIQTFVERHAPPQSTGRPLSGRLSVLRMMMTKKLACMLRSSVAVDDP